MALAVGTKAPDFSLPSTNGQFTLSKELAGKPCIIYFYPRDFTNVCTKEACSFRDEFSEFKGANASIVGISKDSVETHLKFKAEYKLPFDLLADTKGEVAKKYKASIPIIGVTKRISYLLDKDHRIIAVYDSLFEAQEHVAKMLSEIKSMNHNS